MRLDQEKALKIHEETGAIPVPDDHETIDQLNQYFGDHTFFVSSEGLVIWEPLSESADEERFVGFLIASWKDDESSNLEVHTPKSLDRIINLG